jgi:hypothetical protein
VRCDGERVDVRSRICRFDTAVFDVGATGGVLLGREVRGGGPKLANSLLPEALDDDGNDISPPTLDGGGGGALACSNVVSSGPPRWMQYLLIFIVEADGMVE